MTAFTSSGTGNWSDATKWSGGSGSDYPGSAGPGDTVVIGAHTITLDSTAATALASNSLVSITASSASAVLSIGANATITFTGSTGIAYSGTNTSGFIRSGSGVTLTLVGPGSGTLLSNTAAGYAIVLSGTGAVNLSNSGGTAISATAASGRGISSTSSGAIDIIGDVSATGSGCSGIRQGTSNNTIHVHGTTSGITNAYAVELVTVCTCLLDGDMGGTTGGLPGSALYLDSATVTWTGSRSVPSGQMASIYMLSGTLDLTDLTLSVSGNFILAHSGGTVTTTRAVIRRQVAGANAILRGQDIATTYSLTVTEPVIPAAGDVDSTSGNFGFAGAPVTPTLTLPTIAQVQSGVSYGAAGTEFTGTLASSGGACPVITAG